MSSPIYQPYPPYPVPSTDLSGFKWYQSYPSSDLHRAPTMAESTSWKWSNGYMPPLKPLPPVPPSPISQTRVAATAAASCKWSYGYTPPPKPPPPQSIQQPSCARAQSKVWSYGWGLEEPPQLLISPTSLIMQPLPSSPPRIYGAPSWNSAPSGYGAPPISPPLPTPLKHPSVSLGYESNWRRDELGDLGREERFRLEEKWSVDLMDPGKMVADLRYLFKESDPVDMDSEIIFEEPSLDMDSWVEPCSKEGEPLDYMIDTLREIACLYREEVELEANMSIKEPSAEIGISDITIEEPTQELEGKLKVSEIWDELKVEVEALIQVEATMEKLSQETKDSDIAINAPNPEREEFHSEQVVPNSLRGADQLVEDVLDELKESSDVQIESSKVLFDFSKLQIDYFVVDDLRKCCEGNGVLVSAMDEKSKGMESLVQQDEEEFLKVENFQKSPKVMVGSLFGNCHFAEVDLMLDRAFDRIDVNNDISIEAGMDAIGFLQKTIRYHAFVELSVQGKNFSSPIGSIFARYAAAQNVFAKMSASDFLIWPGYEVFDPGGIRHESARDRNDKISKDGLLPVIVNLMVVKFLVPFDRGRAN